MAGVLERIHRDHANLAMLLDAVERQLDRFDRGETPDYQIIEGVVDYCLNYPDLYHHPLEDLIVRRLCERDPDAAPAIDGLEAEHKALADTTRKFAEAVQDVLQEQEVPRDTFHDMARDFLARYRNHMQKEEETFLPVAAKSLSPKDLAEIEALGGRPKDPMFGDDGGARFESLREKVLQWSREAP